jgi:hypothetical protein
MQDFFYTLSIALLLATGYSLSLPDEQVESL